MKVPTIFFNINFFYIGFLNNSNVLINKGLAKYLFAVDVTFSGSYERYDTIR